MPSSGFSFHSEAVDFNLNHPEKVAKWIHSCIEKENRQAGEIAFIFTTDAYLLELNQKYLNHDTYTDVIGFDYSSNTSISGDVFISLQRVRANALKYGVSVRDELHRVMIHGILHFCGYTDDTSSTKAAMKKKEDYYLSLRTF